MAIVWPPVYDSSYLPTEGQPYWSPTLETMAPEERHQQILEKLRAQVRWAYQHSNMYRRLWKDTDTDPNCIASLEDFHRLPFLTKDVIREDQALHPPFGSNLCEPPENLFRIHGSTGTTGAPTILAISKGDWRRIAEAHARVMWGMGIRPSDTVFIAAPFSLYMGSWGALLGAERLGARSFPFGAGNPGQTRMAVRWLQATRPTVFYGTSSFALYLAETAREEGVDPQEGFGFRIMFFSGEPGASVPATRRLLQETYGAKIMDSGSTAEMSPWMSNGQCSEGQGMHLWQDIVLTEVVDRDTKQVVPYGHEGVPVYTHLERTSQPMIRFWSGDLTRWIDDPCPCGRTYPRLPRGIYGRVDDMVIIRGENVYPSAVENVVRGFPGLSGEFRLVVTRERAMDRLIVLAEYAEDTAQSARSNISALDTLRRRVETELRSALGVRADVELKAPGELERTQFKAKRVIDQRDFFGDGSAPTESAA